MIPLKAIFVRGDCNCWAGTSSCGVTADACAVVNSCPGLDTFMPYENLKKRVDYANRIFKAAGVQFYVRSISQVAAPTLAIMPGGNNPPLVPWSTVRDDIRRIYPSTGCNDPTLVNVDRSEIRWSRIGSTYFSAKDEITLLIHTSAGPDGGFPWKDRAMTLDRGNLTYNSNLAHELGHFLGLAHSFGNDIVQYSGSDLNSGTLRNPETNTLAVYSDYWDLVHRNTGNPTCDTTGPSPCFFTSKAAAQAWESELVPIYRLNRGGTQGNDNCFRWFPNQATGYCYVNTATRFNGDPLLAGIAFTFVGDNPSAQYTRGWNNMGYLGPLCPPFGIEQDNWLNALSQSQIEQVRKTLRFDVPMDQTNDYPNMKGSRPLLGQHLSRPLASRVDFNNDGKRDLVVWEPPSAHGQLGTLKILLSPSYLTTTQVSFGRLGDVPLVADFDGDGKTDFGVFRSGGPFGEDPANSNARFLWCRVLDETCSSGSTELGSLRLFGTRGDIPLPGLNFSPGSSPGEIAVFRPSNGKLYWDTAPGLPSGYVIVDTGGPKLGQQAFFELADGDALTDMIFYNPATAQFSVFGSTNGWLNPTTHTFPTSLIANGTGGSAAARSGGIPFVTPRASNRASLRVWSADDGYWYTDATLNGTITSCQWGLAGDVPLAGFFGLNPQASDFAVYRGKSSSTGSLLFQESFNNGTCSGTSVTTQTSSNYRVDRQVYAVQDSDGDGKSEIVVLDDKQMVWTLLYSGSGYAAGSALVKQLGAVNGVPL